MKFIGIAMAVFGLIWSIFALNMDVNVKSEAQTYGAGEYAINVPSVEVVNIGLMDKRRNHLIFSGFVFLAGVILIALGKDKVSHDVRACPFCAEKINTAAVLCRFCHKEIDSNKHKLNEAEPISIAPKKSKEASTFVHCKKCTALNDSAATACFRCEQPLV